MSDIKVPIKTWLDGELYVPLSKLAKERGVDEVGQLLALLAQDAVKPAPPRKRPWRRVTPDLQFAIENLHRLGYGRRAIAERLGISESSVVNHLPLEVTE